MRLALLILASCAPLPEPLPPNVEQACARVVECGACTAEQLPACVTCVEHWAEQIDAEIIEQLPPLETVDCETITAVLTSSRVAECIIEEWWK